VARLTVPTLLAHWRNSDRRRRKVYDAPEQITVFVTLLRAEQRIGMPEKRGVDSVPICIGQVPLGKRQQIILLQPHVLPVKRCITSD
jgi:hypothetical protein